MKMQDLSKSTRNPVSCGRDAPDKLTGAANRQSRQLENFCLCATVTRDKDAFLTNAMIDRKEKPKIPWKLAIRPPRYNEFRCEFNVF